MQKEIKGKQVDFWWCDPLSMWARHKPEDCKAKHSEDKKSNTKPDSTKSPKLKVAQAATYVMSEDDRDDHE